MAEPHFLDRVAADSYEPRREAPASTDVQADRVALTEAAASAEYFGTPDAPLFGWLHAAAGARAPGGLGVLVCAPLGHEMVHCHRTLRVLAELMAAQGLPSLRLDYAGCGDSADGPPADSSVGRCASWLASIEAGIDHLCARSGVARVALLAVRSGALLAATVAARRPDVACLAALAPVSSGRRLLREWRALQGTAASPSAQDDGLEVAGFSFDAPTCKALGALELTSLPWPAKLAVLVIDRDDLPPSQAWITAMQTAGLAVEPRRLPGMAAMLDEPQRHVVPMPVVQACVGWLTQQARRLNTDATAASEAAQSSRGTRVLMPRTEAVVAAGVRERVVQLSSSASTCLAAEVATRVARAPVPLELFGIVAEPTQAAAGPSSRIGNQGGIAASGKTLLLVNTGAVHHIGGHRLYVDLARHLAAQGHRVLRFDLSGIGDSNTRPGEVPGTVYGPRAVDDIALALQAVQQRWPGTQLQLLGLCAGAYHALKFAVAHPGAAQALIINPLVFQWREGMSLETKELETQAAYYGSKWRKLESWRRLVSGQSDLRMLLRVASGRAEEAWHTLATRRPGAQRAPELATVDLGQELQQAAAHGTRLRFIFAEGEPGWPLLQSQAGATVGRLQAEGLLSVQHLAQADHTFSKEAARRRLMDCVEATL